MPLITEKIDVQNKIINCLISIGWDYLLPSNSKIALLSEEVAEK